MASHLFSRIFCILNLCNNYLILFQDPKEAADVDPYVFVSFVSGQRSIGDPADPPVPKERLLNSESTDEEIVPVVVFKRTYRRK